MTAKAPKRPRDPNQLAKLITDIATGEADQIEGPTPLTPAERGRLGGKVGGRSRADKLSPDERSAAAKKAATARWGR